MRVAQFPHLWSVLILCAGLVALVACGPAEHEAETPTARDSSAGPSSIGKVASVERIERGTAVVERLPAIYVLAAGPHATAKARDWRLSNEHLSLTFASVDTEPTTISLPISGWRSIIYPEQRIPGAIIDLTTAEHGLDFLAYATQAIGLEGSGNLIQYDTAEPLERGDEVGLRLEGSPFDHAFLRVETTYWIAAGRGRVRIETRLLNLPEGDPPPDLVDFAQWTAGESLVQGKGKVPSRKPVAMAGDYYLVTGGNVTAGFAPAEGRANGRFAANPPSSRVQLWNRELPEPVVPAKNSESGPPGATATTPTQTVVEIPAAERRPPDVYERDLWVVAGQSAEWITRMVHDRDLKFGTLVGTLTHPQSGNPVVGALIEIQRIDPTTPPFSGFGPPPEDEPPLPLGTGFPYTFAYARTDEGGRVSLDAPRGFYSMRQESVPMRRKPQIAGAGELKTGATKNSAIDFVREPAIQISVVDGATSQPLASRIMVEPIPPTPAHSFGFPIAADGYLRYAYLPPASRLIPLPEGKWIIHVFHGIAYDKQEVNVQLKAGLTTNVWVPLHQSNPTPGWFATELGVRTKATPGCVIEPDDIILMAIAEGIDWIVSGDFEVLTDLQPLIERLGYADRLKASRGFRTVLPAHPEWGHFLIFPVAEGAPDPAQARLEWKDLTSAAEFIAALRRLYPDALIQSDLPFTRTEGLGYFLQGESNPEAAAYNLPDAVEPDIDAINILPSRELIDMRMSVNFWYNNWIAGRRYIPSTSSSGQSVLGAEPGYPRLLVMADVENLADLREAQWLDALRQGRVQLTNAPFIDFDVNGARPGDLLAPEGDVSARLRVTAPNWVDVESIFIDKEGVFQHNESFHSDRSNPQRYPPVESGEHTAIIPAAKLAIAPEKDTLLGAMAMGNTPLDDFLPRHYNNFSVRPFSLLAPIVIDRNRNERFDPLSSFREKGK